VATLLARGADPSARILDQRGATPLHEAAATGQLKIARTLLACGANINAADSEGWTALHVASARGDGEMVWILLQFGAWTQSETAEGQLPRDLALEAGHQDTVTLLDTRSRHALHSSLSAATHSW